MEGEAFSVFPLRVVYLKLSDENPFLQAGFTVGTRHFKRAVHRNRIKRLMRESYRIKKHSLKSSIDENEFGFAVFFIYTGKELPEYTLILKKMTEALERLETLI